jgi:hypothetical protein
MMPAKSSRPNYRCLFTLIAVILVVPMIGEAQTVKLTGRVSETVSLDVAPDSTQGDVHAVTGGGTVRLTLSGKGAGSPVIRVPLLVRSNSSFKISGKFESTTAQLAQLSVMDVQATGRLVSPAVINSLQIRPEFDAVSPFVLLSGPRVSLGGTLNSPNNALQITLLIRVKSDSVGAWLAHLTFFND